MLERDVIHFFSCPRSSPATLVAIREWAWRVCVDNSMLKKIAKKDGYIFSRFELSLHISIFLVHGPSIWLFAEIC